MSKERRAQKVWVYMPSGCAQTIWLYLHNPNEKVVPLANTMINNMSSTNHQTHVTHQPPPSMADNNDWTE
jgi:hypothetical protein